MTSVADYTPVLAVLRAHFSDRLRTVVLFGSQARRDAAHSSDHDLFVVADGLPRHPLARARELHLLLVPILCRLPGTVSFVARTVDEMVANLSPLVLDVCAGGVCLYGEGFLEPLRKKALAALGEAGLSRRLVGGTWMWVFPEARTPNWTLDWDGFRDRV